MLKWNNFTLHFNLVDLIYWLYLLKTPLVGVKTFYNALKFFEEPEQIFKQTKTQLQQSGVFGAKSIDFILQFNQDILNDDLLWVENENCYIITIADSAYPQKLKETSNPPPLLWVRGDLNLLQKQQLAIVGSRNPTSAGSENAYNFAYKLADKILITSGMATGIDSSAHLGALESQNPTIAVCGTGLDRVYPAKNANLARQICKNGALVSELPIGTRPLSANFPRRNRIITGMSDGVLLVEALEKSGSMISVRTSLEQGRDVFAIPGSIKNPLSSGPHTIIKDGAILTDSIEDIIQNLNLDKISEKNQLDGKKYQNKNKKMFLSDNILLKYIDYDGISFDDLILKTGLNIDDIASNLMQLELDNIIENTNNTYILK